MMWEETAEQQVAGSQMTGHSSLGTDCGDGRSALAGHRQPADLSNLHLAAADMLLPDSCASQ